MISECPHCKSKDLSYHFAYAKVKCRKCNKMFPLKNFDTSIVHICDDTDKAPTVDEFFAEHERPILETNY